MAHAEGASTEVEDELFRFARVFESSDELRSTLTDQHVPAGMRQAIIEDLLGGKASALTTNLVSFVVLVVVLVVMPGGLAALLRRRRLA